jgi:hypothetical protein
VKESLVPPFPLVSNLSISISRRTRLTCAAQGFLICCLSALPAPCRVLAQDTSQNYAGPLQPDGWTFDEWRPKKYKLYYTRALTSERLGNTDKENLKRGVEYYLYGMTQPTPPDAIFELRRSLLIDLRSRSTKDPARQFLLDEIVRVAPELLDQPPGPRLNVLILLASLDTNQTPEPPLPYVPANQILLDAINDPDQLVECKIWAAIGLGRISRDGNPGIAVKNRIAEDLVKQLATPEAQTDPAAQNSADWWYRMRLLEALGDNGLPVNVNGEPIVIDAMMEIVVDPNEHWLIRSTAARACTQLKWGAGTNVSLINYTICQLVLEMARTYNQERDRNVREAPYWRRCFFNAYLCYRPLTAEQRQRGWGLLQQAGAQRAEVEAAYRAVLPVTNAVTRVVAAEKVPQPAIDGLGEWLENNQPDDWKVTPASEKLNVLASPPGETTTQTPGPGEVPETQQTEAVIGRPSGS